MRSFVAGLAALLGACGGDGGLPPGPVAQIVITAPSAAPTMGALGRTLQFQAQARDDRGTVVPGVAFAWASSNTAVATISGTGLVTAVAVGTTQITASGDGQVSSALTATVAQVVAAITVTSSSAVPDTLFATGRTRQFSATARDSNSNVLSTQPAFGWTSGASAVANVNASGLVTAVADGSATIAAFTGPIGGIRGLVVRRLAASHAMSPASATIATDAGTAAFTGSAMDSSGAVLTPSWTSRSPTVLFVSPAAGGSTTASGVGNGSARVVMSVAAIPLDSASVTVSGQVAVSFANDVQPVFTPSCAKAGCHSSGNPSAGLSLVAGLAYANIVNVNANSVPGIRRVAPGDPNNSFLIIKMEGTDPRMVGARMPDDGPPFLPPATVQMIRRWIAQGALNN